MTALWVAVGGALGAALRFTLAQHLDRRGTAPWHPGTLLANTAASLVLGACTGAALDGDALALVGTGLCGGLSTYSSLAVQTRDLGPARGAAYAAATVVLGLGACSAGFLLTR